ncbi:PhzF family phenazine biosynthesis protein [Desulfofalx alkaliphila]|uniref:PhzF family phenazine biosynthesis protein n=1 Tax=Desulfofalx alkaliphila TaxID=105483 RepID=UPI0004E1423C|nr:PhzF family phenazine biosynthesis protein [Desulfofalx alkaliphila]
MMELTLYILDVFAEKKYAGNQLAVIRNANLLSDNEMQGIAKEMNFSETTFILSDKARNGGYDVRIFTPEEELPFAGHPTLGTAYVIKEEIINKPVDSVILNLKVGQIPVTFENEVLWMKQIEPSFGSIIDAEPIAKSLGIEVEEIDTRFNIQEVSTGLPFIIVPLKTLNAVRKAKIQSEEFRQLIKGTEAKAILVFCPETYKPENHLNARVFVDFYGIPEDPATGSANGCLAGYLVKNRYFNNKQINIRVEQGYEIGRPSLLLLKAREEDGSCEVLVGGNVIMVAKGELV